MYDVIWRPFWNFAYKKVAYGCQSNICYDF